MGKTNKTRDFTANTIVKFEQEMSSYFDEQTGEISNFWDRVCRFLGIFDYSWFNASGEADKYIKSLSDRRDRAETEIVKTWTAVADVEAMYEARFRERKELCGSYSNIVKTIASRIELTAFEQPTNWGNLLSECAKDYEKFLEIKALEITNKSADELTDEDIEILAYVALTTTDDKLKGKIYNTFYRDTSTEHVEYVYGSRDRPYRVYDRADEQWEKFVNCTEYYYATEYQAYFDGERTEEKINDVIRNKLLVEYMDETGKTLFATGAEQPVHFSTDGNVTLTIPADHIVVHSREELRNSKFVDREHIPLKKRTYNSNLAIANGAEAERDIAVDISDGMYIERQFDWKKHTIKAVQDAADLVLPGSGKVIGTADKIFTTIMDTAQKLDEYRKQEEFCEANKPFYQWFVGTFNIKCVTTENGYLLYPSKDTEALYQKMLIWLKENGYLKIYNMYRAPKEACFDGAEMTEAEWFVANVDVTELYNVLDGTGKLDEFASALC